MHHFKIIVAIMVTLLTTVCSELTGAEVLKQLEALTTTSQDIQKTVGMISGREEHSKYVYNVTMSLPYQYGSRLKSCRLSLAP